MIKKLIKSVIAKIFNFFGYNILFSKKSISSLISIDKNTWEAYYKPDHKMNLYFEGLKRSGIEQYDGFGKQLRLYGLQNMVYHIL